MRVMTYNIRYANPNDGEHSWPRRRDRVATLIHHHRADLVGIQEALGEQVDDLAERLPGYGWTGVGRLDGANAGEFVPIFYNRKRVQYLRGDTFWLSETPAVAGSKGWDARYVRIVTWAEFCTRCDGTRLFLFNTHFDNIGEQARRESAHLLLARLTEIAGTAPAIITGDFNSTDTSDTYRILTGGYPFIRRPIQAPLDDSLHLTALPHFGPLATLTTGFGDPLIARVDYIFVRNVLQRGEHTQLCVQRHGTLAHIEDGHYASDHLPVVADLRMHRVARKK